MSDLIPCTTPTPNGYEVAALRAGWHRGAFGGWCREARPDEWESEPSEILREDTAEDVCRKYGLTPVSDTAAITQDQQRHQPYTILLMLTDDMRSNEACAADWIRRVWVEGEASDVGIERMIKLARCELADLFGWTDPDTDPDPVEIEQRKAALEPVAIYAGHVFDIYQA